MSLADSSADSLLGKLDRLLPRNLQFNLSLLVTGLLTLLVTLISLLFVDMSRNSLKAQIGRRVLEVARTLALDPDIRQGLAGRDSDRVQLHGPRPGRGRHRLPARLRLGQRDALNDLIQA